MSGRPFYIHSELQVRNMLSSGCMRLCRMVLEGLGGISIQKLELGRIRLSYNPTKVSPDQIEKELEKVGFPVIHSPDEKLVEEIKVAAVELIHFANNANSLIRNSDYLSEKLDQPYQKLSKTFKEQTGITLEKFLILLKIEKVKDLLMANDHTLSEIAFMMGYSSVQYLSNQFKKVSGVTVSEFREDPYSHRIPIDMLTSQV